MLDFKKIAPIHNEIFGLKLTGLILKEIEQDAEIAAEYSTTLLRGGLESTLIEHYINRHPTFSYGEVLNALDFEFVAMMNAVQEADQDREKPDPADLQREE